jgi:hypothetical protein
MVWPRGVGVSVAVIDPSRATRMTRSSLEVPTYTD